MKRIKGCCLWIRYRSKYDLTSILVRFLVHNQHVADKKRQHCTVSFLLFSYSEPDFIGILSQQNIKTVFTLTPYLQVFDGFISLQELQQFITTCFYTFNTNFVAGTT